MHHTRGLKPHLIYRTNQLRYPMLYLYITPAFRLGSTTLNVLGALAPMQNLARDHGTSQQTVTPDFSRGQ